ncbi:MAG TPA: Maf family protein [Patescibacteria group bacterium]|nr:Maf family protein [Patescibacteria group bacterium]
MKKIILASSSPRRQDLMKFLGIPFDVVSSDFDETRIPDTDYKQFVEALSFEKAKVVAAAFDDAIIIGADTVVVLDGKVLGKPKDKEDAAKTLKLLSGTKHLIITGYTIFDTKTGRVVNGSVESAVKLKVLTDSEIKAYIETGEPMDKAGSYAVQGIGGLFVERVEGDYFNIVGLPLKDLRRHLADFGVKTLPHEGKE